MPSSIRFPRPIRVDKLTRLMQIEPTDVLVHWTVLVVLATMLAETLGNSITTMAAFNLIPSGRLDGAAWGPIWHS